jgi:DNA-directed RNA polymerase subunit F
MVLRDTTIGRLILDSISSGSPAINKTASVKYTSEETARISRGLTKVASLPYKTEAYQSTQEMMKIAAECLDALVQKLESAEKQVSNFEKAASIRGLIDLMVDNGLIDKGDVQEKIAELVPKSARELEIIKEAVKLASRRERAGGIFEFDKTAGEDSTKSTDKRGMFDGVLSGEEVCS